MNRKNFFFALILSLGSLFFSGCSGGDSADKVVDEMMAQMDRMVTSLGTIKDKPSAEKAMAEMKDIAAELKKLADRAKAIGKVTGETKTRLEAKMAAKQGEMQKRTMEVVKNLPAAGPEAMAVVQQGMTEFGKSMQEFAKAMQEADK